MRIIIQCAATKHPDAGTFRAADGRKVAFVAEPCDAPLQAGTLHVHPDDRDPSDPSGPTWRQRVEAQNAPGSTNPWGLMPAGELYRPRIYRALIERYGVENVFILSAGWGLVRADWRLPDYDIAFGGGAAHHQRRRGLEGYQDWVTTDLWEPPPEPDMVFLGGRAYLPLFQHITGSYGGRRLMFYPTLGPDTVAPQVPGCATQGFTTTQRTNWHYACAEALIAGQIQPDFSGAVPFRRDRFLSGPEDITWVSDGPVAQGEPVIIAPPAPAEPPASRPRRQRQP